MFSMCNNLILKFVFFVVVLFCVSCPTGDPSYQQLSVYDINDYSVTPASNKQDVDFIRSQSALAATWRPAATRGKAPVRYEWTVQMDGHPVGQGLLDVDKEPIWRETGHEHMAVYTTRSSRMSGRNIAQ